VLGDPLVRAAVEVVRERRSERFTRFDGNLAGVVGPEVLTRRFSATRLQTWAACPHAYLLQYVLRVEPVEEPERRLEIDPLATGSLVHEVLDRFVREAVESGHPLDGWGPADERRLLTIAEECFASYEAMGLTGRALLWRRDRERILTDLRRFLDEDGKRLAAGIRPLRTELSFDDLQVRLPDGTTITVAGAIDRVDRGADGSLVVLDYKTGSDRRYKDLSDAEPHLHGTKLQPYLYAKAAAEVLPSDGPVWAGYWFTSDKGKFACRGYDVTPDVAARVEDALAAITSGIAAGTFPARPNPQPAWGYVDCWYCRPDGLSAAERRREWEAKRHDPQVRAYAEFAEPEEVGVV
jgi:RecB family exonuclease